MVRDGIYYGAGFTFAALVVGLLTNWWFALPALLVAAFFLWFFRDPERDIPQAPGLIIAPADGKVTDVSTIEYAGEPRTRISIFLNVFDVHVNRTPIAGTITQVRYQRGRFQNAMGAVSSDVNEQNIVTVVGEGQTLVFKQIAGLLARRIVFSRREGDTVARGERIGMMKFGSRMDVIVDPKVTVKVKMGDRVRGGTDVIALAPTAVEQHFAGAQTRDGEA